MSLPPDPPLSTSPLNLFLRFYCPKDGGNYNYTCGFVLVIVFLNFSVQEKLKENNLFQKTNQLRDFLNFQNRFSENGDNIESNLNEHP
jgi:hypothetical protein